MSLSIPDFDKLGRRQCGQWQPAVRISPMHAPFPLMPSDVSLEIGNAVVHEWCARAYTWWRGGV